MNSKDAILRGLSRAQLQDLLARSKHMTSKVASSAPVIERIERGGDLPLSFSQQRLWFIARLEPHATHYNISATLALRGMLDTSVLRTALDALYARHEVLRSMFVERGGEPQVRLLEPSSGLPFTVVDARQSEQAPSDAAFDLSVGPLARAYLVRVGEDEHLLTLLQHHIVSDGWSLGILVREWCELYRAIVEMREPVLPVLTIQYPDFAAWQRVHMTRERLEAGLDYWRGQLTGAPEQLTLPTDRPRPARQSTEGASVPIAVGDALTARLKAIARAHHCSLYVILLAAWSIVLSRLSGQDEVVIGSPSANRDRREIEPLAGFFVNTLALRVDLSRSPSLAQLVAAVRDTVLAAQAHQSVPFELIVETLNPPRRRNATPLFQVMFNWQNNREPRFDLPGLSAEVVSRPVTQVKFDVELNLSEQGAGVAGAFNYATALFDAGTLRRHAAYLTETLQAIVEGDAQPALRLPMLPRAEYDLLVDRFAAGAPMPPPQRCVHDMFEAQVRTRGGEVAIECGAETVSYAELNMRANRIAHALRTRGVRPEQRVALFLRRSVDMVAALLGVLKAGAAYVPLDPGLPPQRLAYMLADAAPACVLSHSPVRGLLPQTDLPVLALDAQEAWATQPSHDVALADSGVSGRSLAYVIYTSGSTGAPKGVMVEHHALSHYLAWAVQTYPSQPSMVALVSSPLAFDATLTSLFVPLLCGGRALLLSEDNSQGELEALLGSERHIDLIKITPLHLQQLGERLRRESRRPKVGCFVVGGEALPASTVAMWRELAPEARIINEYGPTETVVGCSIFEASASFDVTGGVVPIGRPIANACIHIVDRHLQLVPFGAVGELLLGGPQVARGYLNQPALTAERFIANPFDPAAGLVYRSGDLGRWQADGSIEYLGRNDFQVKVRGFRVELGEVEAHLSALEGVQDAVVIAGDEGASGKQLVAYAVAREGAALQVSVLRAALARALPSYMVPAAIVLLPALPLTANGKLDRAALPAPGLQARATQTYVAPQGELEESVARIWADLLGVQRVGRDDHFFELGGHSLMATRMLSRVQEGMDVTLELSSVFDHPQLSDFAESILMGIYSRLGPGSDVEALIEDITDRKAQ
ncbi:non-ribosomal peptide synthetase [Xanthomonas arboricola]|uniref:non-ribosomal peptide synthetase n=1 Tax=Xanthomonas arboricola TaxID=56448 RepID=UPI0009B91633|nr:non-ribosomal peptide synthetase [Xanthomonas arboricola]